MPILNGLKNADSDEPLKPILPGDARACWDDDNHSTRGSIRSSAVLDTTPVVAFSIPAKEDLLHQVLGLEDDDISFILAGVLHDKPHLRRRLPQLAKKNVKPGPGPGGGRKSAWQQVGSLSKSLFRVSNSWARDSTHSSDHPGFKKKKRMSFWPGKKSKEKSKASQIEVLPEADPFVTPIVQFSAAIYFCLEGEGTLSVDVMRFGDCSGRSAVGYQTRDGTAFAGRSYETTSGIVVFEPGDFEKYIEIPLIDNETWDTTLEFLIELDRDNVDGAALGRYLWQSRVKIIDDDTFPTSKYKEQIVERRLNEVAKALLLLEYIKLAWADSVARRRSIHQLLFDQSKNIHGLLKLFMEVYLVDYVLNSEFAEDKLLLPDRVSVLVAMLAVTILPGFVFQLIDDLRTPPNSGLLAVLQRNLMRRYLNYDTCSRQEVSVGELTMTTTRDAAEVVNVGYMNALKLVALFVQLFWLLVYLSVSPAVFDSQVSTSGMVFFCVFPFLMLLFLILREPRTSRYLSDARGKEDEFVANAIHSATNYQLIADYNRRPVAVEYYEGLVNAFRDASVTVGRVMAINEWFAPLLTTIAICIYQIVGGVQVVSTETDSLSLGMFLTTVSVLGQVGSLWSEIYKLMLEMQTMFPALERLVVLMNMPTDVPKRMKLNRHRRATTSRLRAELRKQKLEGIPIDHLPITVTNIDYHYSGVKGGSQQSVLRNSLPPPESKLSELHIQQGQLVSLVGPIGQGKSTLLKVIGGVILPEFDNPQDASKFFIPAHLRTLHISLEPMFFRGTLLANLAYGVNPGDKDGELSRVLSICRRLDIPPKVLEQVEDAESKNWTEILSHGNRCIMGIARGLVANPEILCIHKPTMVLCDEPSRAILSVLREFVDNKGLEVDPAQIRMRRPRTCIITSSKLAGIECAHRIFHVSTEKGICEIAQDELSGEMFM